MAVQSNEALEELARLLIEHVRDEAVQACDRVLGMRPKGEGERWQEALGDRLPGLAVVIPDIVDEVVFQLLDAIDNGLLPLSFRSSGGRTVDLHAEGMGELGGWYLGTQSWRSEYVKTRFHDDFADLDRWPLPEDPNR